MLDISNRQLDNFVQFFPNGLKSSENNDDTFLNPNYREINRYDCGKWKSSGLQIIVPQIQRWKTQKLWLNANHHPLIVKEIQNIKFPSLKLLLLNSNNLVSIESLCEIEMPSLQLVSVAKNHLIEIKIMRKGKWSQIKNLLLNDNQCRNYDSLSQLKADGLRQMTIETISSKEMGTINWVAKMETNHFQNIYARSKQRIKSKKVLSKIKMKNQEKVIKSSSL